MDTQALEALKYPIGRFKRPSTFEATSLQTWIEEIEQFPKNLRQTLTKLTPEQHQASYRPGGWTVQQLIHHVADSHMNSYIRFKWSLTEPQPTIKAYDQELWANTPEIFAAPTEVSVNLLDALHARWVILLRNMAPSDWEKSFVHPETQKVFSLGLLLPCTHGTGNITSPT